MLQDRVFVKVVTPADVSTNDLLQVDTDDLGLSDEVLANSTPVIVGKTDSSGNGAVMDEIVAITGGNLQITEGSTGFAAGDIYIIELLLGLKSFTATAAASS